LPFDNKGAASPRKSASLNRSDLDLASEPQRRTIMTSIRILLASGAVLAVGCLPVAHAQQTQPPEAPAMAPDLQTAEESCEVAPGGDVPTATLDVGKRNGADQTDESLSATLERCGGVLTPPAVGDPEMVEPAPDEGVTPIIPPSSVPTQE
jgi:hypothetical protein